MAENVQRLVTRLPRFVTTASVLGMEIPPVTAVTEGNDVKSALALLKSQLYSAMISLKAHSLRRAAMSLLESLASLALEDLGMTGHCGNSIGYIDHCLTGLQSLPGTNFFITLGHLTKTEASVRARKMNISNQLDAGDCRSNFLNRLDQVEQAISLLRQVVLHTLARGHGSLASSFPKSECVGDDHRKGMAPRLLVMGADSPELTDTEYDEEFEDDDDDEDEEDIRFMADQAGLGLCAHSSKYRGPGFL